ncbi:hypothetical protein FF100_06330 [Methylobacterium terricola]|uniref:PilZ domain-containing protein n=1 Tax=Methylobacterium terricola TaxID=2583531 RepID=A0A5C4LNJ8_9HYPH|nr:PilZ domain-containing protein [Methylobacterium terricola]TNC15170.1 hypothetical protein FF100_06330 [Methylobacterium terricola]
MSAVSTIATGEGLDTLERREADKRSGQRYGTSMPATILMSHYDRVPCVVRDLSDSGAKIGLSRRYILAERFWIVIRHADVARRASLVWRRGEFAGIAFDRPLE